MVLARGSESFSGSVGSPPDLAQYMACDATIDGDESSNEGGGHDGEGKGHNGDAKKRQKAEKAERKRRRKRDETWRLVVAYKT